jgi:hypothetical protein
MIRTGRRYVLLLVCALWVSAATAQESPTAVTFSELLAHPAKWNGRLVRFRASLVFGWEGDNFLYIPEMSYSERCAEPEEFLRFDSLWLKPRQPIRNRSFCLGFTDGSDDLATPKWKQDFPFPASSLWFYCRTDRESKVFNAMGPEFRAGVTGWFTGYFHLVLTPQIVSGAFNPGFLQFEAIEFSKPVTK